MTGKRREFLPRVAVLVLGYNDIGCLNVLFTDILKQQYGNFSVTFIDNSSSDGSSDFVKKQFPEVETVTNKKNLGFSAAFNKEMYKKFNLQKCDAVIVMNSDMAIDDVFLIQKMVHTGFSSSSIALVQPKLYLFNKKKDKLINTLGNEINYLGFGYMTHFKEIDSEKNNEDRDIVAASGACLLIKKEFYLKAGGFDEDYFAYMEDVDLSWRTHLMRMRVVLCADIFVWHKYDFERQDKSP
ncbi:glycosyltransferase family 2 protein [bacterium]|nr:glycosyltransferase family 2 protein [bacterium]